MVLYHVIKLQLKKKKKKEEKKGGPMLETTVNIDNIHYCWRQ